MERCLFLHSRPVYQRVFASALRVHPGRRQQVADFVPLDVDVGIARIPAARRHVAGNQSKVSSPPPFPGLRQSRGGAPSGEADSRRTAFPGFSQNLASAG